MQDFDTFKRIFHFFVESKLNPKYVDNIDQQLSSNEASDETKKLIDDVQSFHRMRQSLCGHIFRHLDNHPILHGLIVAGRVEQHDSVARKSVCAFTNQNMSTHQGLTLVIGSKTPHIVTIHKRFKRLIYNFWYLVHFTDEIIKEIKHWLVKQRWWKRGNCPDVSRRVLEHQNSMFVKQAFVKLKTINEYIQREMATLPINH